MTCKISYLSPNAIRKWQLKHIDIHLSTSPTDPKLNSCIETQEDWLWTWCWSFAVPVRKELKQQLSFCSVGSSISADTVLRTGFRSLASQLTSIQEVDGPEAMQIDGDTSAAPTAEDFTAAETSFQEKVLSTICDEYIYHSRTEVAAFFLTLSRRWVLLAAYNTIQVKGKLRTWVRIAAPLWILQALWVLSWQAIV